MDAALALFHDACEALEDGDLDNVLRWFGYTPGEGDEQWVTILTRVLASNQLAATQLVSNIRVQLTVQQRPLKAAKETALVQSELACAGVRWPDLSPETALVPHLVAAAFSRQGGIPEPFFTTRGVSSVIRALAQTHSPDESLRVAYKCACTEAVNAMLVWVRHTSKKNAN